MALQGGRFIAMQGVARRGAAPGPTNHGAGPGLCPSMRRLAQLGTARPGRRSVGCCKGDVYICNGSRRARQTQCEAGSSGRAETVEAGGR